MGYIFFRSKINFFNKYFTGIALKLLTVFCLCTVSFFSTDSYSQNKPGDKFAEWTTWVLFQTIPSPSFYQDRKETDSRLQFGLRWQVTPFNYSFNANKLVSPVQFFKVNPVRRYGGSLELFMQPEWVTADFRHSDLSRFNLTAGVRGFIPAAEYGEYLSISLGGKYNFRKNKNMENAGYYSVEAGLFTFFGILGFTADYNFTEQSRYNLSVNLKYY
ncbi:MAG: hypothetical protein IPM96_03525 [Ignavibacteria bacterium]|nr:hypothetical protein [Ignavibacteria bacterium]